MTGKLRELAGSISDMAPKETTAARRIVMENPTFSPDSTGMTKTRVDSM